MVLLPYSKRLICLYFVVFVGSVFHEGDDINWTNIGGTSLHSRCVRSIFHHFRLWITLLVHKQLIFSFPGYA